MSTSPPRDPKLAAALESTEIARMTAQLRAAGYVVYRKPTRRRGNHLTYTDQHGTPVKLEQLEIPRP
jgi:hypothetical protein